MSSNIVSCAYNGDDVATAVQLSSTQDVRACIFAIDCVFQRLSGIKKIFREEKQSLLSIYIICQESVATKTITHREVETRLNLETTSICTWYLLSVHAACFALGPLRVQQQAPRL